MPTRNPAEVDLNNIWAQRNRIWAEGNRLQSEGNRLQSEGDKLRAQGNTLFAFGDTFWEAGILGALGKTRIEWGNWNTEHHSFECTLPEYGLHFGF